ncbi:MAG TPA: hypothetical protein DEB39_13115 [Planctomycetaceae bacterium]|nr:hypothetical protein [Planctomycetaceae bacterium]
MDSVDTPSDIPGCPAPHLSGYFRWKSRMDRVLAVPLFLLALPFIAVAVAVVRLTSTGPGIYKQIRVGKNGNVFAMYKIRTMRVDAEAATGAVWARPGDPRITRVGKILRNLHIDEFPQFWNVIRGDMSLVGPRPERPEIVNVLDKKIDGYILRLQIKPGITGFAQLNHHSDHDLNDVRKKVVYDLEYIQKASLWFDLRLLFGTGLKSLALLNPTTLQWLGLYKRVEDIPWAEPLLVSPENISHDPATLSSILTC